VNYTYKLKDPIGKLHAIVLAHLAKMRTLGNGPNRTVTFTSDPSSTTVTHGWLIEDPGSGEVHQRYLLLENGDVWVAEGWLEQPTDELALLLPKALLNAQIGGHGFLVEGEDGADVPVVVEDRRLERRPFDGPEKRGPA